MKYQVDWETKGSGVDYRTVWRLSDNGRWLNKEELREVARRANLHDDVVNTIAKLISDGYTNRKHTAQCTYQPGEEWRRVCICVPKEINDVFRVLLDLLEKLKGEQEPRIVRLLRGADEGGAVFCGSDRRELLAYIDGLKAKAKGLK